MEIPLKRKYLTVSNGHQHSGGSVSGITKPRMDKTALQKAQAEVDRQRKVWYLHLQANGKLRMKKPD